MLWCRSAVVATIQPLAWEPPYAAGVALKNKQKTKKQKKKKTTKEGTSRNSCPAVCKVPMDKRDISFLGILSAIYVINTFSKQFNVCIYRVFSLKYS